MPLAPNGPFAEDGLMAFSDEPADAKAGEGEAVVIAGGG